MTYCISDIHGCYDEFMELLEKINFSDGDKLYILGDVVDRGKNVVKCFDFIMDKANIQMLMGNHEYMMLECIFKNDSCERWQRNGSDMTLGELNSLSEKHKSKILGFAAKLPFYAVEEIGGRQYILVHAGVDAAYMAEHEGENLERALENHDKYKIVWLRKDFYENKALNGEGKTIVFGHTPTRSLREDKQNIMWIDEVYKDKIGIDCACVYGGKLCALRLEDMKEFYVESHTDASVFE